MKAFLIGFIAAATAVITVKAFGFIITASLLFGGFIFGFAAAFCRNRISRKVIRPTLPQRGPKWAGSGRTKRAWRDFRANRRAA